MKKLITLYFLGLIFIIFSSLLYSEKVVAGMPTIDRNCKMYEPKDARKIIPQNQGTAIFTSQIKPEYSLQLLKFPDGIGVFCLYAPSFHVPFFPTPKYPSPQKLSNADLIQDKLIEKIEKDPSQPGTYVVTVKATPKMKNPDLLKIAYRLNLRNPDKPKVTEMIKILKR